MRAGGGGPLAAVSSLRSSRLRVFGYASGAGFQLTRVGPAVGPPLPAGSSAYTLSALGAGGHVIATVPMAASLGHMDGAGPLDELSAEVPARGVSSIQVTADGRVLATRTRSRPSDRARRTGRPRTLRRPAVELAARRDVAMLWQRQRMQRAF